LSSNFPGSEQPYQMACKYSTLHENTEDVENSSENIKCVLDSLKAISEWK
jgi:hypothetical protein